MIARQGAAGVAAHRLTDVMAVEHKCMGPKTGATSNERMELMERKKEKYNPRQHLGRRHCCEIIIIIILLSAFCFISTLCFDQSPHLRH